MSVLPRSGPSHTTAFCILSICSSVQRRSRWARELFRSSSLAWSTIIGFSSVPSMATGAPAPFRKSHVSVPTSAVNSPRLTNICGNVALSCLEGVAQRMLLSRTDHQGRLTREGSANIYYDHILGHNDSVYSDFACSLVKSSSFTFLLNSECQSGIFCLQKRIFPCVSFWTSDGQTNISGFLQNSPWRLVILSRVSNFSVGIRMRVKRLRCTSLLVLFRMHFIELAFPNGFDIMFA